MKMKNNAGKHLDLSLFNIILLYHGIGHGTSCDFRGSGVTLLMKVAKESINALPKDAYGG